MVVLFFSIIFQVPKKVSYRWIYTVFTGKFNLKFLICFQLRPTPGEGLEQQVFEVDAEDEVDYGHQV